MVRVLLALEHGAHGQHALLDLLRRRSPAQPGLPHPRVRFVRCHGVDPSFAWLEVVVGQLHVKLVHARLDLLEMVACGALERAKHVEQQQVAKERDGVVGRDLVNGLGLLVNVHEAVNVEDDKLDQFGNVAHRRVVLLENARVEAALCEELVADVVQHRALAARRTACDHFGSHRRRQVVLGGERLGLVCGVHCGTRRRRGLCCGVLGALRLCGRHRSFQERAELGGRCVGLCDGVGLT